MEYKKNSDRFSIKFKHKEPKHQMVIELLNRQGRNKADYIVQAIVEFEKHERERQFLEEISKTVKDSIWDALGSVDVKPKTGAEKTEDRERSKGDANEPIYGANENEPLGKENHLSREKKPIGLEFENEMQKSLKMFTD